MAALAIDTLSREGLAKHIYGESSYRVEMLSFDGDVVEHMICGSTSLSENRLFDFAIILLIILYFVWLIRYAMHRQRGDYTEARWIYGDQDYRGESSMAIRWSDVFYSAALLSVCGMILISLVVDWVVGYYSVSYGDTLNLVVFDIFEQIQQMGLLRVAFVSTIYICGTMIWLGLIYFLCSLFSLSDRLYSTIIRFRTQFLYQILIFFIPVLIFFALNRDNLLLSYVVVAEVVVFFLLYLIRGFLLFITQKISILQWFLYLCTVEIVPIAVAWMIFVRRVSVI